MKKIWQRTIAILLTVLMLGGAAPLALSVGAAAYAGIAAQAELTGIAVQTMPMKTVYASGESFDASGLTLTATYADGSTETITSGFTCDGFNSMSAGTKRITVTYKDKSTTFTVTVNPPTVVQIAVKTMPYKLVYNLGEAFDQTNLRLTATLSNKLTRTITTGFTCTGFDSETAGIKTITVTYEGLTTSFTVEVIDPLKGIAVETLPTKTTYFVGESFDDSGLTLTATYEDGSTKTIESGFTCTGFSSTTAGEKTITVTYQSKTTTFNVTVDPITPVHIAVMTYPKTEYNVGEPFDQTNLQLSVEYSDGSVKTVTTGFTCSGFDSDTAGEKTITVAYQGLTTTFTVTIVPVTLVSIAIETLPAKTTYYVGESFEESGLTLTATYSNATAKTVTTGFTCTGFDPAAAGSQTITVTYQGLTTTFSLTVEPIVPKEITIRTIPTKTTYGKGESFDQTGLTLRVTFTDDTTQSVFDGFTCAGFDSETTGEKEITVTYQGLTTTFTVTVVSVKPIRIAVKTYPKQAYNMGEDFDQTGMAIRVFFSDGTSQTAFDGFTCTGFDSATAGEKEITVTYQELTTTFTVTVVPADLKTGQCGDDVYWSFDPSTGTLTITGTDETWSYSNASEAPWHADRSQIKTIVIGSGVTRIGRLLFDGCENLRNVTIPDSVTNIGSYVFRNCTSLANVPLPDSVISIGIYAFENTAFYNNSSNWTNNALYLGRHLLRVRTNQTGDFTVASGTRYIAGGAFEDCADLTGVTIPTGVTAIGMYAFEDCKSLARVTIPDGVTILNMWTFFNCTGLVSVTIPDSVTYIDESAFSGCTALRDVYYSGTQKQWKRILIESGNDPLSNATLHTAADPDAEPNVTVLAPSITSLLYLHDYIYLHAIPENLPEGAYLVWSIEGTSIIPINNKNTLDHCMISGHPENCSVFYVSASLTRGTSNVICTAYDANGEPLMVNGKVVQDSVELTGRGNFFMLLFALIVMWFMQTRYQ